jgi:endoglucanase
MLHRTRRVSGLTAALTTLATGLSAGLLITAAPGAGAAEIAARQGERFALSAAAGQVFADASASGQAGLLIWSTATATTTVTTSAATNRLHVRVRGDQCLGAPLVRVAVDGTEVALAAVPSTTWTRVTASGTWQAGQHTVAVTFPNDHRTDSCDRNLRLDRVSFATADASTPPPPAGGNPLAGAAFWVDPDSQARREMQVRAGDTEAVAALRKIATQPNAEWFGDWVPTSQVRERIAARTSAAAASGAVPVLVLYAIPGRDCGSYSAGGLSGPTAYAAWIRAVADGLGDRRAVVVLEPDGLAQLDCLAAGPRQERIDMLRSAVQVLGSTSGALVYLDAGNSGWIGAADMASRLRSAGVAQASGFATNVSNFHRTPNEVAFGDDVSARLDGAHYVVDTSRNGLGPAGGSLGWCNPQGRALGDRPTTRTASAAADAYLWIKMVGQSDGECGRGEPAAGTWWPEYAIGLAQRAAY